MRQKKQLKHLILLIIFLFSVSCTENTDNSSTEIIVDSSGGTFSQGDITLEIPEGALEEEITIDIHQVGMPDNENFHNAGNFYRIAPDNQQFLKDVTITMVYQPHILDSDIDDSDIQIWTAKEYTFNWQALESSLDKQNFTVTTTANHFSLFGPAVKKENIADGDADDEQSDVEEGTPVIYTESLFDFGPVLLNTTNKQQIMVTNKGDATLIISESTLVGSDSDAFNITNPNKIYIQPNYKLGIEISFTPTEIRDYSTTLIIDSNDPEQEQTTVQILGKGTN